MAHEAMEYDLQVQLDHGAADQPAPAEVVSSQGGPPLLQPPHTEEVSSQEGPPMLHPVLAEVVSIEGGPPLLQPIPEVLINSPERLPLLPPIPQISVDLTEEVELSGTETVGNLNPGVLEEFRLRSGANHTPQVPSLNSVNSFISGLQRLHGMLEFLRPTSDRGVGPVRTRRNRRSSVSRRARAGGSQRTNSARLRAPLDAFFQASRTQPHSSTTSYGSETRNPVSDDLQVSGSSDSDGDSSIEFEEGVAQAEEPEAVVLEEQLEDISADQAVTCVGGEDALPKQQSPQKSNPSLTSASVDEEEGDTCTICLEQWTNAGDHRLSALRCGHLFGYKCISKWLRGHTRKCPQCNKKAKQSDIVVLYARTLRALDTSEQELMKSSLQKEQKLRKKAELDSAQCRLQLQALTDECSRLQSRVQDLQKLIGQDKISQQLGGSQPHFLSGLPSNQSQQKYHFQKTFTVSQTGNCRVMTYCDALSCLVVSQPSPQAAFLPGFGVKMLSTANMKSSQYIPMHGKQIRGLAFSSRSKGLLLSASLDNTIKLTSLETNTVVQTYSAGRPVWSCCWCLDENNYIYAGLANGSILLYDLRNTSSHVQELVPQRARCPLVSLSYVPRAASAAFPYGGVLAGALENASFWELKMGFTHWPHVLPMEPGGCVDFQVESSTRHCLVTYRPDKNHNTLRSVLMEMSYKLDNAGEPICSCHPVQTFLGGPSCKLLTKSAIFQNPENNGSILVCTGDEASKSALEIANILKVSKSSVKDHLYQPDYVNHFDVRVPCKLWDAGSGLLLQDLQADQPVLDICPFEVNHNNYLATLTEKTVHIYRWE